MHKLPESVISDGGPQFVAGLIKELNEILELLTLLKIYPVVNVRRIVKYWEQVKEQKKIPPPLVVSRDREKERV